MTRHPKYDLYPVSALGGFDESWGDLRLHEVTPLSLISLAVPLDAEASFQNFIESEFGLSPVFPGMSQSKNGMWLLGLARDLVFLVSPFLENPLPRERLEASRGCAYLTDQSDSWAHIEITGPGVRTVLERICSLNLHSHQFSVGSVARTIMDHLGVIIWRTDENTFRLMSARSSARCFLNALVCSIENTR